MVVICKVGHIYEVGYAVIYKVEQVIFNVKKKTFYSADRGIFTDLKKVASFALPTEKIQNIKTLFSAIKPRVNGTWHKNDDHKPLLSFDGKIWKSQEKIRHQIEIQWGITDLHDFKQVKSIDNVLS